MVSIVPDTICSWDYIIVPTGFNSGTRTLDSIAIDDME